MKKINKIVILLTFLFPFSVFADIPTLDTVRVVQRDDGVSVISAVSSYCEGLDSSACLDREQAKSPETAGKPYMDMPKSQLPQDRKDRDKWRLKMGQGISIDKTLTTKREKMDEIQAKIDNELDKANPSSIRISRLQRSMQRLKEFKTDNGIIPKAKLGDFDEKQVGLIATVVEAVSGTISSAVSGVSSSFTGLLSSIRDGFLSLKTLVVGTPENPAGITVYDQSTGEPFCLVVKNGKPESIPGACGPATASPSSGATPPSGTSTPATGDTEPPVIQLIGESSVSLNIGDSYVDPGATVTDNVNSNLGVHVEGAVDTATAGDYVLTYSAEDSAGNKAIEINRVVTIVGASQTPTNNSTTTNGTGSSSE
jgi:hypothetical protein